MSTETKTTDIKGNSYSYTQLSACDSLKLKFTLAGIIGAAALSSISAVGKSESVQMEAFSSAMVSVFKDNDPDKILDLIKRIFVPCFRNGERVNIDNHFKGEFLEMYEALFWVLKMEYGDFLAGARSIL